MNRIEWDAYLAGLFDGEGSISIFTSSRYPTGIFVLAISNSNMNVLNELKSIYDGSLVGPVQRSNDNIRSDGSNKRSMFRLQWSTLRATRVLEILARNSIIKTRQIALARFFFHVRDRRRDLIGPIATLMRVYNDRRTRNRNPESIPKGTSSAQTDDVANAR